MYMLEFLVDNIFVFFFFAGKVFKQTVSIPICTNCGPFLADIFLYSYKAELIQYLLSTGKKQLASRFNLNYGYIDDTMSLKPPEFENYLGQMYNIEVEMKDTTENITVNWEGCQLHTFIDDKQDDFNCNITYFQFNSIFAGLWRFYLSTYTIRPGLLLI